VCIVLRFSRTRTRGPLFRPGIERAVGSAGLIGALLCYWKIYGEVSGRAWVVDTYMSSGIMDTGTQQWDSIR
jgi:hypothetical protein